MKFLPVSYLYYEGYIWAAALESSLVAVSLERSAERSGDSAHLTGGRDRKNAGTERPEDFVGRPWGLWRANIVECVMKESGGCLSLPVSSVIEMTLILIEESMRVSLNGTWADSGVKRVRNRNRGITFELVVTLETSHPCGCIKSRDRQHPASCALEFFDRPNSLSNILTLQKDGPLGSPTALFSPSFLSHTPFILRFEFSSLFFFRPSGEFLYTYSYSVLTSDLTVHASAFVRYCETVHQRRPLHYLLLGSQSFILSRPFLITTSNIYLSLLHNVVTGTRPHFRLIRDRPGLLNGGHQRS